MVDQPLDTGMRRSGLSLLTVLTCVCLFATACSSQKAPAEFGQPRQTAESTATEGSVPSGESGTSISQDELLTAQSNQCKKAEVLFSAPVLKLLADDRKGTPHQRFLLQLSNGTTVLVAHNTRMAPKVPLQAGDVVVIKGEYIWNDRGGVVHWTHHTDTPRHPGGYIQFNGQTYQ